VYHHVGRGHLGRYYCDEFAFRYENRKVSDDKRTTMIVAGGRQAPDLQATRRSWDDYSVNVTGWRGVVEGTRFELAGQRPDRSSRTNRPGMLPPLGVDFETALGALLKTPPPPKGEAAEKRKARKRKAGRKR
jgi:hypothetical protein